MIVAALLLSGAQPQPPAHDWLCARNFAVADSEGIVTQAIAPDGAHSPVAVQVWETGPLSARLQWWRIPEGGPLTTPGNLTFSVRIAPQEEALWVRFYADGRDLGRELVATREAVREGGTRRAEIWGVRTDRRPILAALMAAERKAFEIVTESGLVLLRGEIALPTGRELGRAYETERRWLESVIGSRAAPCVEDDPERIEDF